MPLGMAKRDPGAVTVPCAWVAVWPWPMAQVVRRSEVWQESTGGEWRMRLAWWWDGGRTEAKG
jgi:hypothetical protein